MITHKFISKITLVACRPGQFSIIFNIHKCFECRNGHSQNRGTQEWALTIYKSVLSVGMGAHKIGVPRNGRLQYPLSVSTVSRYGHSKHLGSQRWALTTFGFSELGTHNIHQCFECRHGCSQYSGSQEWALTINMSVLTLGMGAHNVGVPRNGHLQYT